MLDCVIPSRYTGSMPRSTGLTWVAGPATPIKVYVTRVINLGTWDEWRSLRRAVPADQVLEAIEHPLRGQWNPRGKSFAECVFGRTLPDDVLISYA
jgi:hypothetical protein